MSNVSHLDPTLNERLDALQEQYAEYRAHAKPRERVPDNLRAATLDLIDAGVPRGVVEASCGVQQRQLAFWRDRRSGLAPFPVPRVLKVVDAPVTAAPASTPGATARVIIEGKRIIIELPT